MFGLFKEHLYGSIAAALLLVATLYCTGCHGTEDLSNVPSVVLVLLVRNKADFLPFFLHHIETLDYPKKKISLWVRLDHSDSEDGSATIINDWTKSVRFQYGGLDVRNDIITAGKLYPDEDQETMPYEWSQLRHENMMDHREQALKSAAFRKARYVFYVDCDNFLTNPRVLWHLIEEQKAIVAPMLNAPASPFYTNFWYEKDEDGEFMDNPEYMAIHDRHDVGCHQVPLVHSTFLVDTMHETTKHITFLLPDEYMGTFEDLSIFEYNCKRLQIPMHVVNKETYGFMMLPKEEGETAEDEEIEFLHLKARAIQNGTPLKKMRKSTVKEKKMTNLGLDQIYVINLKRQKVRRARMNQMLKIYGMWSKVITAVDERELTDELLAEKEAKAMETYKDEEGRPISNKEMARFMSHYAVWQDIQKTKHKRTLVLEDNVGFNLYMTHWMDYILEQTAESSVNWDIIYLGRQPAEGFEPPLTEGLVVPNYSKGGWAYLLSVSGANKLLNAEPLSNIIPVDEFFHVLSQKHPNHYYWNKYKQTLLFALSFEPTIAHKVVYPGDVEEDDADNVDKVSAEAKKREQEELKHKKQEL